MTEESEIRTEIRPEGFVEAPVGDTTVVPEDSGKPLWTDVALCTVKGAVLGVMLILGVLAACCVMEYEGGESFAGWIGLKGHELLVRPGMKRLIAEHGEDAEYNAPGWVKSKYILKKLVGYGFLLGAFVGLAVGIARFLLAWKRGPAPDEDEDAPPDRLPVFFPLGVAIVGIFWQGFVWGNAAILSLAVTRRRKWWLTGITWIVAFTAVFLWAWGLQTLWEDGWSKQIPPGLKEWIYWFGNKVGMKE